MTNFNLVCKPLFDYYKTHSLEWKRKDSNIIQVKAKRKGCTYTNDTISPIGVSKYKSGWDS